MSTSTATRDHETIRRWAQERGAIPSEVATTHKKNEPGILRFHFPGAPGERDGNLREISWEAFFEKFDENDLSLLYQDKTAAGQKSNFNKLVHSNDSPSGKTYESKSSGQSGSARKLAGDADVPADEDKDETDEDIDEEDDLDEVEEEEVDEEDESDDDSDDEAVKDDEAQEDFSEKKTKNKK